MWVFCCGMLRSASTLQFQITTQLIGDRALGQSVGWIDFKRFPEVRRSVGETGFKVIKVHVCTEAMAAEFQAGNAIGIYAYRDIRDAYASYMQQRQKPFEYLWQEGFVETCLDNYARWTRLPKVLVSEYESIVQDLPTEVSRIAQHLKISVTPEECNALALAYSPTAQHQRMQTFREKLLQASLAPNDHRELVDYHDEASLLHINHLELWQSRTLASRAVPLPNPTD
ncbi:MAG: sulfotransferase domain-containing protein [Leptolyngbyaceae cyanobacterium SL_7_1]|nr:sulfotransferase domain-containing protein [Leptolyngbyaceae cyanobacterium SL_7_1]